MNLNLALHSFCMTAFLIMRIIRRGMQFSRFCPCALYIARPCACRRKTSIALLHCSGLRYKVGDSVSPVTAGHWIFSGWNCYMSEIFFLQDKLSSGTTKHLIHLGSQSWKSAPVHAATSKATEQYLGTNCAAKCPVQPDTLSGHFHF